MPCSKYPSKKQRAACYATDGWGQGWSTKYGSRKATKKKSKKKKK